MSTQDPSKTAPPPPRNDVPVGKCKVCNIDLYRMMHYSCSREGCPVFPIKGQL